MNVENNEMEPEIMAAERAVEAAKEKLVAELEAASENGREALARVVHTAKPMAIGVAAVAGVALLAGAVALVRASFTRPRARYLLAPEQRSLFGQIARQALTSAAGTVAAAVARRALLSLEEDVSKGERANGRNSRSRRPRSAEAKPAVG